MGFIRILLIAVVTIGWFSHLYFHKMPHGTNPIPCIALGIVAFVGAVALSGSSQRIKTISVTSPG